ncbi:vascular endothelial growth factor A-A-like isoform X2 [Mauremys mutica]|uniref:vascular endothelial growth factor A-A-like isoform X2 n=1 Tax=Mauremys mutica TaxID=74926 RepID=UPI001D167173|nr:vascular endothelial growth factor A-A-like isoform X2 [Mauremys mutica]
MRAPGETLHLLLATALQLIGCAAKAPQPQTKGTPPLGEVMQWMEVYNRSFCQPKEMLVPVSEEHPAEVEHLLAPSCVPLRRCAGCCADEGLQCVPTRMHMVVMEVMKTRYLHSHLGQLAFVEHSACECRPKTNSKVNPERFSCPPCSDKRKRQDPQTCQCRCRRRSQHCRDQGLELNEHSCRMQSSQATALLTLCLWALCHPALGTEGKRKLQIGVKKRVENCPIKSRKGDVLHMHYTGKLEDGTEFDSSIPRDQPFIFSLGTGQVIKGWDQGLLGMCEGEKRKLVIPSELGYGDRGAPPKIPGGATLIFEVELLKIERRPEL